MKKSYVDTDELCSSIVSQLSGEMWLEYVTIIYYCKNIFGVTFHEMIKSVFRIIRKKISYRNAKINLCNLLGYQ